MMARSDELREHDPMISKTAALSFLLVLVALMGLSSAVSLVWWVFLVEEVVWGSAKAWRIVITLTVSLIISGAALWGLLRLKPWGGPIPPTTLRTNTLILLSGLVLVPATLALFFAAFSMENWYGIYSNSAIPPGIAIFAIASWLLALAIGWWCYYSADEHERRANDLGLLIGSGVFMAVTPAWWVAARAGFVPQPDAMVLWGVTMAVAFIVWFWYRYR